MTLSANIIDTGFQETAGVFFQQLQYAKLYGEVSYLSGCHPWYLALKYNLYIIVALLNMNCNFWLHIIRVYSM